MPVTSRLINGTRRMRRLFNQTAPRKLLAIEAATYLLWAKMMVARLPMRDWRRRLGPGPRDAAPEAFRAHVKDIVWAVESVGRTFPKTFACLPRAVAACCMLSRRGYDCQLRIGVLRGAEGQLDAHAWVERLGQVILGRLANLDQYVELTDEQANLRAR